MIKTLKLRVKFGAAVILGASAFAALPVLASPTAGAVAQTPDQTGVTYSFNKGETRLIAQVNDLGFRPDLRIASGAGNAAWAALAQGGCLKIKVDRYGRHASVYRGGYCR